VVHAFRGNPSSTELGEEGPSAGCLIQLRGSEHASNYQGRARQFLHRANAFGDEKLVSFASLPSPEVAREGQETHVFTV
jgi:hypothetical protein